MSNPHKQAQPEIDFNGTTFTVTETKNGKRLEIYEFGCYQELFEEDVPALISFLAEHFGDTK